jgi:hypothetical protein
VDAEQREVRTVKRDHNWRIIDARPEEYLALMRLHRASLAANPAAAALDRFAEAYCEYWHAMTPLQRRLAACAIAAEIAREGAGPAPKDNRKSRAQLPGRAAR